MAFRPRADDIAFLIYTSGTTGRPKGVMLTQGGQVAAAEILHRERPEVVWLFLGDGYHRPLLEAAAARCPAIRLVGPQARHAVFGWFALADVSVVAFRPLPVLDANSPAKLYDSLSVGTPVVVTNDGWTRAFVAEHQCGWYVPAADPAALAAHLTTLLDQPETTRAAGRRGQAVAAQLFDRRQIAATIEGILQRVGGRL